MQEKGCRHLHPVQYAGAIEQQKHFSAKGSSPFLKRVASCWKKVSKLWANIFCIYKNCLYRKQAFKKSQKDTVLRDLLVIIKSLCSLRFRAEKL